MAGVQPELGDVKLGNALAQRLPPPLTRAIWPSDTRVSSTVAWGKSTMCTGLSGATWAGLQQAEQRGDQTGCF